VCSVDEADIGSVKPGQRVRIVTEAFPNKTLRGEVDRVDPAATTTNSVTAVSVRVKILKSRDLDIKPGMNATCEFITMEKRDVVVVPPEAVKQGSNGPYVLLKGTDPKQPVETPVKTGEEGNDGIEIISGIKEGDQVVTAQLDVAQLKAIQDQMAKDQSGQSGGLAGGGFRGPTSRGTGTRAGGGARAGGGGRTGGSGGGSRGR